MLKNKIIWLTGASKGIGLETAKLLHRHGAIVIASARTNPHFSDIDFVECDVASSQSVKNAYRYIIDKYKTIDVLINNAGVISYSPLHEIDEQEFDRVNDINYKGPFLCSKAVLPDMIKKASGKIITIHSIVCFKSFPNASLYTASKTAGQAMMKCLREEVRSSGIDVINIYPGATETDMWDKESVGERVGKMMMPQDVAQGVVNVIETSFNSRMIVEEIVLRPKLGDL